jgi:hypothetical protein
MMTKYYADRSKMITTTWFHKHVVFRQTTDDPTPLMIWRAPDTGICLIQYIIYGGALFVSGDLGSAVYRWSDKLTFDWLAGLDLSYFAGKCEASETGRTYKEWDEAVAKWAFDDYVDDIRGEYAIDNPEAGAQWWQDLQNANPWAQMYSEFEWQDWMSHDGMSFFSTDDTHLYTVGQVLNLRCQSHLIGLKMAQKWLDKHGRPLNR